METGGKQYRVGPGETLVVEKLPSPVGAVVELDRVLLVAGDDGNTVVGRPYVPGARVVARVAEHGRGPKIIVFKYRPKKRYRRKTGHRQPLTRLVVEAIRTGDGAPSGQA